MADIFDSPLANATIISDTPTDADSPVSELLFTKLFGMIQLLIVNVHGQFGVGSLTSDPPNDTTGYIIDTAASFTEDQHNSRRVIFTSGAGIAQDFEITDTEAANNRIEVSGTNLYSLGVRSGDEYIIVGDFRDSSNGHQHDDVNSLPTVDLSDTATLTADTSHTFTGLADASRYHLTGILVMSDTSSAYPFVRLNSDTGNNYQTEWLTGKIHTDTTEHIDFAGMSGTLFRLTADDDMDVVVVDLYFMTDPGSSNDVFISGSVNTENTDTNYEFASINKVFGKYSGSAALSSLLFGTNSGNLTGHLRLVRLP